MTLGLIFQNPVTFMPAPIIIKVFNVSRIQGIAVPVIDYQIWHIH